MVADPDECHRMVYAGGQLGEGFLDVGAGEAPGILVRTADTEGEDGGITLGASPVKQPRGQGELVLLRPHHDVESLAGGTHQPRQHGCVAERVDIVADERKPSECPATVVAAERDLLRETDFTREVAIGLEIPAADDLPLTACDQFKDPPEKPRCEELDLLIDPRLAPGEDHVGVVLEQGADRFAGVDDLIQPGGPRPEPDRVDVRVADEMDGLQGWEAGAAEISMRRRAASPRASHREERSRKGARVNTASSVASATSASIRMASASDWSASGRTKKR